MIPKPLGYHLVLLFLVRVGFEMKVSVFSTTFLRTFLVISISRNEMSLYAAFLSLKIAETIEFIDDSDFFVIKILLLRLSLGSGFLVTN